MKKYALLLVVLLVGCRAKTVDYDVTGSTSLVDITIADEGGGTAQFADVPVPWGRTIDVSSGDFVYVSAQNQLDTGSVTVKITYDGVFGSETIDETTSVGAYVIATASGSVP